MFSQGASFLLSTGEGAGAWRRGDVRGEGGHAWQGSMPGGGGCAWPG